MKKFLTIIALCLATSAYAGVQSIDTSKLSKAQIAELAAKAEEMGTQSPTNISANVRKEAEAWGDLGSNMGKAMVSAAREVGVASNEFASTSLGKVVVAIVTYKIIGRDILGIFFGSLILVFGYSLALWVFATRRWSRVKYEYEPVLWGMYKRQRVVESYTDDDTATSKLVGGSALLLASTVIGLMVIF